MRVSYQSEDPIPPATTGPAARAPTRIFESLRLASQSCSRCWDAERGGGCRSHRRGLLIFAFAVDVPSS